MQLPMLVLVSLLGRKDGWAMKEKVTKATRAANYCCSICALNQGTQESVVWSEIQPKCSNP